MKKTLNMMHEIRILFKLFVYNYIKYKQKSDNTINISKDKTDNV